MPGVRKWSPFLYLALFVVFFAYAVQLYQSSRLLHSNPLPHEEPTQQTTLSTSRTYVTPTPAYTLPVNYYDRPRSLASVISDQLAYLKVLQVPGCYHGAESLLLHFDKPCTDYAFSTQHLMR